MWPRFAVQGMESKFRLMLLRLLLWSCRKYFLLSTIIWNKITIEGVPEPVGSTQGTGRSSVSPRQPGHQPQQGQKKITFKCLVLPLFMRPNWKSEYGPWIYSWARHFENQHFLEQTNEKEFLLFGFQSPGKPPVLPNYHHLFIWLEKKSAQPQWIVIRNDNDTFRFVKQSAPLYMVHPKSNWKK